MEPVRIEILLNDRASQGVSRARRGVSNLSKDAKSADRDMQNLEKTMQSMDKTFRRLAGAFAVKELVSKIATVRGEVQQLEVAFRTMLGGASQADELLQQLVRTAAITPFGLEDVANGAKQLLAYGLRAEKVNEALIRLGDIAAGLSVPLNDLVYLYGTTMAQGRLYTQDLNQFTGRGIPMISELAKQFGVAESKVKELVEAGKVGFPEVQKVIESLTDEGGKFGGLMEEQSKTITGQISNIEDAVFMMFNEIGQQSEGIINSTLSGVSYMIENYERFGRILLALVGTYGVYRTAIMAVVAMKGWATAAEALHYNWLLLVEKAQKMLNATMLKNPYVLVATLMAGVVAAMVSMKTETERLREKEEEYNQQKQKNIEAEQKHMAEIEKLCSVAEDEAVSTDVRREALQKLEQKYPDIFAKYKTETEMLENIKRIKQEIAELEAQNSITNPTNELAYVEKRLGEIDQESYWRIANNEAYSRWVKNGKRGNATDYMEGVYHDMREGKINISSTADYYDEYKTLLKRRKELKGEVRSKEADEYFANLTGISDEELRRQIQVRKDLLAKMEISGNARGTITGNIPHAGSSLKEELQAQLQQLQRQQEYRDADSKSGTQWVADKRKAYQDALKAYNDYVNGITSKGVREEDFDKETKRLKDELDTAQKAYDKVKPAENKDADNERSRREAQEKANQAYTKLLDKQAVERKRAQEDHEMELWQNRINLMKEGAEKVRQQAALDHSKELSDLNRRLEDDKRAEVERQKQLHDAQEAQKKASNKKYIVKEFGEEDVDSAPLKEIETRYEKLFEQLRQKQNAYQADVMRGELEAMRDYLKQYGSYQQKKLAIAEEYAKKIQEAQNEGEKQRLTKERDSAVASVEAARIKDNIDWSVVFGDFGGMFRDVLQPALDDLRQYVQTDEFKNSDAQSQKDIIEAMQQMKSALGSATEVSFAQLGKEITAYETAMAKLREAENDYAAKRKAAADAEKMYLAALESGNTVAIAGTKAVLESAQNQQKAAETSVNTLQQSVTETKNAVSTTATNLKTAMDNVTGGLQKLASGSVSGAFEGVKDLSKGISSLAKAPKALKDAMGKVSEKLESVPIIGWIAQIIDLLKDGISVVITGILDTVFSAISGIIGDILNFKDGLFRQIGESLITGIMGIFESIFTLGGWFDWIGNGESNPHYEENMEKLTASNDALRKAIENLTGEMSEASALDAIDIYNQQKQFIEQSIANTREQMGQSLSASKSGFGGKHSSAYFVNNNISAGEWNQLSHILNGKRINSVWDFWGLSPEEMAKVANNAPEIFARIKDLADDGYKNAAQYMDIYVGYAKEIDALQDTIREKLTGISFSSLRDNFKSQLLDMESDAETFGENLDELLFSTIVENLMSDVYSKRLKDWYENFADAIADDGKLDDNELASLRGSYKKIVDDAIAERDAIADAMGYEPENNGSSQSGRAGTFTGISQDQGTKLEGLFVSAQIHLSSIDDNIEDVTSRWGAASDSLRKIEENTGRTADRLDAVADDIKKIIRDGIKTK